MSNKKKIPDFRSSFFCYATKHNKATKASGVEGVFWPFFGCFLAKKCCIVQPTSRPTSATYGQANPFESQANNHKEGKKVLKSHCSSLFTITTMVSDSTVKPSLNLEFLFYFMVKRLQKFLDPIV